MTWPTQTCHCHRYAICRAAWITEKLHCQSSNKWLGPFDCVLQFSATITSIKQLCLDTFRIIFLCFTHANNQFVLALPFPALFFILITPISHFSDFGRDLHREQTCRQNITCRRFETNKVCWKIKLNYIREKGFVNATTSMIRDS
jgi:hypothetical protein